MCNKAQAQAPAPVYSEKPSAAESAAADTRLSSAVQNKKSEPSTISTTATFVPTHTLTISTRGISWFRLPLPPRDLVTEILRGPNNPAYTSTRHTRCSGNCVLTVHPSSADVAQTTYFFGPGRSRSPLITFAGGEVTRVESGGGIVGRNASFMYREQRWEWRYESDVRPRVSNGEEMKTNLLVLYRSAEKVAELVRNDETRTEGTGRSYAGNGGVLVLGNEVDEVVVVATACVMLKREVDRRRLVQMIMAT